MGDLTDHFSLSEFIVSSSHSELLEEIRNSITEIDRYKMFLLCRMILEPLRADLNMPIQINSGKRSASLNKAIGGAPNSDHLYLNECAAVDFTLREPFKTQKALIYLLNKPYLYGQVISYPDKGGMETFIHVSMPSKAHYGERLRKVGGVFAKM